VADILIRTNGTVSGTEVRINGRPVDWLEINFGVSAFGRGHKPKLQLARNTEDGPEFVSFYAGDFAKLDEVSSKSKTKDREGQDAHHNGKHERRRVSVRSSRNGVHGDRQPADQTRPTGDR